MTELKTLKDIDFRTGIIPRFIEVNADFDNRIIKYINNELKQEAIKWVKDVEECRGFNGNKFADGQRFALMYFFNLTEEDLGDKE